ncbi:MAG: hypothetical protein ACW99A_13360 [Candidatus Kariarchaeaceae archaeon]|jgi:hypothetical protein
MAFINSVKNAKKNIWFWVILTAFIVAFAIFISKACEEEEVIPDPPAKEESSEIDVAFLGV